MVVFLKKCDPWIDTWAICCTLLASVIMQKKNHSTVARKMSKNQFLILNPLLIPGLILLEPNTWARYRAVLASIVMQKIHSAFDEKM